MAEKIIMPKAGMAMESGVIIKWLKEVGDKVEFGEPLLEIESDKTSMQVEAMNEGYLLSKLYDAGATVPVVTTIGYIGEKGEQPPAEESAPEAAEPKPEAAPEAVTEKAAAKPTPYGTIPATPAARRLARERGIQIEDLAANGALRARDIPAEGSAKATPLAKRLADMRGVELDAVSGSGHGGKIFSGDLPEAFEASAKPSVALEASAKPSVVFEATEPRDVLVQLNGMRKTIAQRMLQSHTDIPPVTLNSEADVTELAELRGKINQGGKVKISFNDLVVKACAVALGEFPNINASYTDEGVLQKNNINIGIAVALDDGLIVPVVKNADCYSLKALSEKARALAAIARDGKLMPNDYSDGTFTVSNLGMFGITSFTPIINQPEACILGVCAITERLAFDENGAVTGRKYMGLSLTFDHRAVDGAGGAKFLKRIVELLENPVELLI